MKRLLNKILKYLGFNVVRAKRPRARKITVNKSAETVRMCPPIEDSIRASGKTHYVGDDCPGGHCEVEHGAPAPTIVPPNNNITGPTS